MVIARNGKEGDELGARLLRDFVDSLPAGSRPVEIRLGQSAVTPADVESPDFLAVPVHRGAEAAERLGEGEDPVEGSALCVDQREVVVLRMRARCQGGLGCLCAVLLASPLGRRGRWFFVQKQPKPWQKPLEEEELVYSKF